MKMEEIRYTVFSIEVDSILYKIISKSPVIVEFNRPVVEKAVDAAVEKLGYKAFFETVRYEVKDGLLYAEGRAIAL